MTRRVRIAAPAHWAIRSAAPAPITESTRLSVIACITSRPRLTPSASRTTVSRRRRKDRARKRFTTLAVATTSTIAATTLTHSAVRASRAGCGPAPGRTADTATCGRADSIGGGRRVKGCARQEAAAKRLGRIRFGSGECDAGCEAYYHVDPAPLVVRVVTVGVVGSAARRVRSDRDVDDRRVRVVHSVEAVRCDALVGGASQCFFGGQTPFTSFQRAFGVRCRAWL